MPLVAEDEGGGVQSVGMNENEWEREREWESVKAAVKWHGISDIHGSTLAGNLGGEAPRIRSTTIAVQSWAWEAGMRRDC